MAGEAGHGITARRAAPGLFFGWRVVGAAFVAAMLAGGIGFYGP